ncbi:CREC-EF hand family protein [Roseomonas marmotae]|uniref:EF-hand domain-containing protein n=1 Tax=Roseomonas marmotae TaxID=2768161 RepID=A0ABS3KH54_9PROT|nr:EF-hand domain-containing protein [Roseomonas marmotae]MBO1076811.1 EF-hand domain-containing protein [Roseomonas marmotae]QTI78726.1 EF-hand domain-containing protein [Roseomonas marmotae]
MKSILALGLFGAALAATSLPALAQPQRGPDRMQTQLFQQADADRDGKVTQQEAMDFLAARFADADTERDGRLTPQELEAYMNAQRAAMRPDGARREPPQRARQGMAERHARIFRMIDANRDGAVTLEELRPVAGAFFRAADANGDGALQPDELRGPRPRQR